MKNEAMLPDRHGDGRLKASRIVEPHLCMAHCKVEISYLIRKHVSERVRLGHLFCNNGRLNEFECNLSY